MISKCLFTIGGLILVWVALAGPSVGAQVVSAVDGASLALNPSSRLVWIEDIFTLDIVANAGTGNADTVDAYIDFDPVDLEVVDAAGTPATTIEVNTEVFDLVTFNVVDNTAGRINFSATRLGNPPVGPFRVATVRFKAEEAVDATSVTFVRTGARISDLYQGGEPLHATLMHGAVTAICPDFAGPPGVGIEDVQFVAGQWRHEANNQPYDCNGDGVVTVVDILCVAERLGNSCSTVPGSTTSASLPAR